MITIACALAYLAASLYSTRPIYAHLRARAIDNYAASRLYSDPVARFNKWDKGGTVFAAVLLAAFWPLALAGFGVYRFITANPALSHAEADTKREVMAKRIRDLERELGIKETP